MSQSSKVKQVKHVPRPATANSGIRLRRTPRSVQYLCKQCLEPDRQLPYAGSGLPHECVDRVPSSNRCGVNRFSRWTAASRRPRTPSSRIDVKFRADHARMPDEVAQRAERSIGIARHAYFKNTENALTAETTNPGAPSRHPLMKT